MSVNEHRPALRLSALPTHLLAVVAVLVVVLGAIAQLVAPTAGAREADLATAALATAEVQLSPLPTDPTVADLLAGEEVAVEDLMTAVIHHVDAYWSAAFAAAGIEEPLVHYIWPEPGQELEVSCTDHDGTPLVTDDMAAFYCPADGLIVISQVLAEAIRQGAIVGPAGQQPIIAPGDFSVAFIVAHEYAHAVQHHLGLLDGHIPFVASELHADCWAGVWAAHAFADSTLTEGHIAEGIQTAHLLGSHDEDRHHGTPWGRVGAFTVGFGAGLPGVPGLCDAYLLGSR